MKENFKKLVKNLGEIGFLGGSSDVLKVLGDEPKGVVMDCFYIRDFAGIDFIPTSHKRLSPVQEKDTVIKLAEETEKLLNEEFITNLTYISGDPNKRVDALRAARRLRNLCNQLVVSLAEK